MTKGFSMITLLASTALLGMAMAAPAMADAITVCAGCHGDNGSSSDSSMPIIGGMSAEYIKDTLAAYKSGDRSVCPEHTATGGTKNNMCQVAKGLSDADIKAAADHYASKPFTKAKQTADAALAAKGKEIFDQTCEKCHSNGGSVKGDDAGILAGQWMPYLKAQLDAFRSDKRKGAEKMVPKLKKLEPSDVDAIVQYLGSSK